MTGSNIGRIGIQGVNANRSLDSDRGTNALADPNPRGPQTSDTSDEDLKAELALDLGQLTLDLTGIVDPTPVSDGTNALISMARGRWFDAAISVVSIIPIVGDFSKFAKFPRYLDSIRKAIRLAGRSPEWGMTLRPVLAKLKNLLDELYDLTASKLPTRHKNTLNEMRKEIGYYLSVNSTRTTTRGGVAPASTSRASRSSTTNQPTSKPSGSEASAGSAHNDHRVGGGGNSPKSSATGKGGKKISARSKYMGRTPGKKSKTGLEVQDRMRKEGTLRDGLDGPEFKSKQDGKWYPVEKADMSHKKDAVEWWNETGYKSGPKSKEVREFMLDTDNYYLEHYSHNRSSGAKLQQTYRPPK